MNKFLFLFLTLFSLKSYAQFNSFRDEGLAYNKFMLEQGDDQKFDIISNYKVKGTPFLFGENMGIVYTNDGRYNDKSLIRYNTYSQKVEVVVNNNKQFITKQKNEIDSFRIYPTDNSFFKEELRFVNGYILDENNKNFLQIISSGKKASLFKAYYSELGVVTTNYVQSNLKQYDLNFDYYYSSPETKGLKKIKVNGKWLKNEFPQYDFGEISKNNLSQNSEATLKNIFAIINK